MKRTAIWGLILTFTLATGLVVLAGEDKKTNELLEAALTKETIEGDLKGAITLYEQAVKEAGSNRALAAKAQMRLAGAYQKQDSDQAVAIYGRVVNDYADIADAASEARSRLNVLRGPSVFPIGKPIANPQLGFRQVTLFDRRGKMLGTVGDPGPNAAMTLSPDGNRVALQRNGNILVFDVRTQASKVLAAGVQPTWSKDGKRIFFEVRSGTPGRPAGIYAAPSDGTGKEEFVAPMPAGITLVSVSPDGRFLTYQQQNPATGYDAFIIPLSGTVRTPIPILATTAQEMGLRISPDGRYVSYRVREGGRADVYVSPFNPSAGTDPTHIMERWKISTQVGAANAGVRWRPDGKELYYLDADGGFTAVEVTTTPSFKAGTPKVLFQAPKSYQTAGDNTAGDSDVSADGQIYALMVPVATR